jgi:phosphatidylserine/phosphatidylglycerophosphate/cardiolipin synthase-like enzyme
LVDADWPNLSLYLHPEMVHAKATLARSSDKDLAFIGSANLVRGSLNLPVHCGLLPYDELNVLTSETSITSSLDASMETLFKEARLVGKGEQLLDASEWYSEPRACWEELWQ